MTIYTVFTAVRVIFIYVCELSFLKKKGLGWLMWPFQLRFEISVPVRDLGWTQGKVPKRNWNSWLQVLNIIWLLRIQYFHWQSLFYWPETATTREVLLAFCSSVLFLWAWVFPWGLELCEPINKWRNRVKHRYRIKSKFKSNWKTKIETKINNK